MKKEYVWYASYGSNLCEDRFLCYIKGGQPIGSSKHEVGCRDNSLPLIINTVTLNFPLYFSGFANRWGGGAAFIGTSKVSSCHTLGRMYLITKEQFIDVVKQENGIEDINIDFDKVIENGSMVIQQSRYGNIVHAGNHDGYPIFTFTYYRDIDEVEHTVPSKSYLAMLIRGYKEAYEMTNDSIADYLLSKPGVTNNYTKQDLVAIIEVV